MFQHVFKNNIIVISMSWACSAMQYAHLQFDQVNLEANV